MALEGEGGFTWGYFGGLLDAATGLIYVGDGQYYNPQTGRFLTRGAQPGRSGLPINLLTRTLNNPNDPNYSQNDRFAGFAGGFGSWQYSHSNSSGEIFADMFLGWVYNSWSHLPNGNLTPMAQIRSTHMNQNMDDLIRTALEN
jgi:hypothetical protein